MNAKVYGIKYWVGKPLSETPQRIHGLTKSKWRYVSDETLKKWEEKTGKRNTRLENIKLVQEQNEKFL